MRYSVRAVGERVDDDARLDFLTSRYMIEGMSLS